MMINISIRRKYLLYYFWRRPGVPTELQLFKGAATLELSRTISFFANYFVIC
jgi:hypothetical protein